MKTKRILILHLLTVFIVSCLGDKKSIDIDEANDTSSFVNKDFKGNLINYSEDMSACEGMTTKDLAELYEVSEDKIHWMDSANNERMQTYSPTCTLRVMLGENDFNFLIGGMNVIREVKEDEMMGDIAKAEGKGENWKEAWALKKSISKSSEWVEGIGKAAVWKGSKRELSIKFDGYTLVVTAPGHAFNQEEKSRNRDYKKIALAMAKKAGFIY